MTERERLTTERRKIFARESLTLMSITKDELRQHYNEIFDRLQEYEVAEENNQIIVPPEYTKIVRCSECENLKLAGTNEKYAHCEKYGFDFLPFKADTRGHFCVQYK